MTYNSEDDFLKNFFTELKEKLPGFNPTISFLQSDTNNPQNSRELLVRVEVKASSFSDDPVIKQLSESGRIYLTEFNYIDFKKCPADLIDVITDIVTKSVGAIRRDVLPPEKGNVEW